ncbi:hypothetical protein WA026_016362 [Henosepilachna vigintioctopunctata]|uniref:Uncharacterized protein n=1 Tax=Henosepilachna vigintioctopunctata TaxID=420089 RepID=A0AAW1ULU6_9CUCU
MECNMTEAIILLSKRENEVTVRAQVIIVLTTVFNFSSSFPHLQKQICETMCYTLIHGNDTRVRLYSLLFWIKRIEEKLTLYGMVDGKFLECVFSFNSKKILQLTEIEIKKRLKCVLKELKEIDCFKALKHAVADKCDVTVSKKSWQVSKKLNDLFDKYGVEKDLRMELANSLEICT